MMYSDDDMSGEIEISKIPLTTLYRWYMYDMNVDNPNTHLDVFEITPVSEEGHEKELEESGIRTNRLDPLLPLINLYASMNAQYVFEMQKQDLIDAGLITAEKLEHDKGSLKQLYKQITFSGLLTMLSSALELGLVHLDSSQIDID
jgi:hypothetical protein